MTAGGEQAGRSVARMPRHAAEPMLRPRVARRPERPAAPPASAVTFEVDLVEVWRRIWRRKGMVLAIMLAGLLAGAAFAFLREPTYTSTVRVMLETRQVQVVQSESVLSALTPTDEVIETEIEVMVSRANKEAITQRVGLVDVLEAREADADWISRLLEGDLLREAWDEVLARTGLAPDATAAEDEELDPSEKAIEYLGRHLGARQVGGTAVMEVAATDEDPALAAMIASTAADSYLSTQVAWKLAATSGANDWLRQRIQELNQDLAAKRQRLEAVRAQVGALDEGRATLLTQRQTLINERLLEARNERVRLETELAEAERAMTAGQLTSVAVMLGSTVIDQLRVNEVSLSQREAELATIYGPKHSIRLDAANQLRSVRASIDAEVRRSLASKRNQLAAAQRAETELEDQLEAQNASSEQLGEQRIQLDALQSEVNTTQTLLDSYQTRFKETAEQQAITRPDARVISVAVPPIYPDFPGKAAILAIALVLSTGAGVCLAYLRDVVDPTLRAPDDLEHLTPGPILQMLPRISARWLKHNTPADYIVARPTSNFAEALRNLYASLDAMVRPVDCLRVLVTSAVPGEGKSATAAAMARLLQRSGKRVAVIECDLRRPRLAHELARGLANGTGHGLADLIRDEVDFAKVIQKDAASGATVVLAGGSADDSMFLLKSRAMGELIDWIAAHHDVVILDSPPVLPIADARVLTDLVDVTLLLCRWGSTRKESCRAAIQALRQPGSPPLAAALTQVDTRGYAQYDTTYAHPRLQHYYRN